MWFRLTGSDYENQAVGTKIAYLGYGEAASTALSDAFMIIEGTGSQAIQSSFNLGLWQQNLTTRNLHQNVNLSKVLTVGPWHHFEILLGLNDLGVANGTLQWWVDGTLIMNYSDVVYIIPGATLGFQNFKFDPVWGGIGGTKTRNDYMQVDHLFISGVQ